MAEGDLFLCPTVRLLADRPGVSTFAYDGSGHRLVLPDRGHLDEPLPLLIVGAGATLRLRNVTIVNSASLALCLQLGAGAGCWHAGWLRLLGVLPRVGNQPPRRLCAF